MFDHLRDEWELDVLRILNDNLLFSLTGLEYYGTVSEDRETYSPHFANKFYLVSACTVVSHEAPTAASWHAILKGK